MSTATLQNYDTRTTTNGLQATLVRLSHFLGNALATWATAGRAIR